jgi:DNA-binding PadR family transcriptional regulator
MTTMTETQAERFLPLKPVVFEIVVSLAEAPGHGYAILQDVRARSQGRIKLETGPLYRHLRRLLDDGLVEEVERAEHTDESDRRRRYYGLTKLGYAVLASEVSRVAATVEHVQALGVSSN